MPVLPAIYTAQVGDAPVFGGRRAEGSDFGSAEGIIGLGKQVRTVAEAYVSDMEEKESRATLVASSEIRAKYAAELDKAALNGSDLSALKQQMNDELAKVGEGFQTKRGTESLAVAAANTNLMYDEQANAINVKRAAAVARVEGSKFLNSAGAIIQRNPAYLGEAEKDAEAFAATLKNISPEQRADIANGLKQELNQAAAIAMTRIDPEGTKKKLDAGEWNLTPDQRSIAINKAESEIRAKRAEEAYARAEKDRQERDANEKSYDTHLKQILDGNGGKSVRRAIMDDPALLPQTREHLITLMERRAKEAAGEEKRSSQVVLRDLWMKASSGQMFNNSEVIAAVGRGELNVRDASFLSSVVAAQKDENGRSFQSNLNARLSIVNQAMRAAPQYQAQPELAAAIQMQMLTDVSRQADQLRKENKDPAALLDPGSKEYYFTPNRIKATADALQAQGREVAGVDLRQDPGAWKDVPVGGTFIDPKGTQRVMTDALKKALAKQGGPEFPIVPSGEKAFAEKPISEATRNYRRAMGLPVQGER